MARSVKDAHEIADDLASREVKLSIGGSIHGPTGPMGDLLFDALAMTAEFEADLIRMRTREGIKVAEAKGDAEGSYPSSPPTRKNTSLNFTPLWNTAKPSWLSCLASVASPSTEPLNAGSCGT